MGDLTRGEAKKIKTCFEEALRTDLSKFIARMKHMENGGGLYPLVMALVEKPLITMALDETRGNQTEAARLLGLNRNTLRRKMTEHRIKAGRVNGGG